MKTVLYRTYQGAFRVGMKFMEWRKPEIIEGENSLLQLPGLLQEKTISNVFIVTDKGIVQTGLMEPLLEKLNSQKIMYTIYDETVPNPTIENIEEAYAQYQQFKCEGIIAFGGGSPMDCAKGVAAKIAKPNMPIEKMKGLFKIRKEMVPFFAIPTTAGTGSEATVAAVISNPKTHEKYAIMDPVLIPHYAILDPLLTVGLPKHITSTTGMDALTHAVESYIGQSNTKETIQFSREAVQLIHDNLYTAYIDGSNIEARSNMQRAAMLAGMAFTRAYVGNVHAIAHTLGGVYGIPHGLANAVILPHVLEFYGEAAAKPLAELADMIGLGQGKTQAEQAKAFIDWVKELNAKMDIPQKLEGIINRDIPTMAKRALSEANPLYPVPKIMNYDEMFYLYQKIQA